MIIEPNWTNFNQIIGEYALIIKDWTKHSAYSPRSVQIGRLFGLIIGPYSPWLVEIGSMSIYKDNAQL